MFDRFSGGIMLQPGKYYQIFCSDDLLYPQYRDSFEKRIPLSVWRRVQEDAMALVANSRESDVNPDVWDHWLSIVNGYVPFGFEIERSK